ncbi:MAG: ABC transporter permease [Anaerolineae bacterium]|nr:ABC transporter permease [Anaerolineae bacterium]
MQTASQRNLDTVRRTLRSPAGILGSVLVALFVLTGVLGALNITPYPATEVHGRDRFSPPNARYVLGADQLGRDVASRLMQGGWNSLRAAVVSVAIAALLGSTLGAVAGFYGGRLDTIIMRLMDILFAFPALLLALVVVSALGRSLNNAIIAIAVVYTPIFARVARGPVLSVKEKEFVTAARCLGQREPIILLRHVLPNILAPLIVQTSLALSWALLTEASLSFLGLGTQIPDASWGVMLSESRTIAERAPWLMLYPGVAIALSVLGLNLLGDALRDALDPRMRGA